MLTVPSVLVAPNTRDTSRVAADCPGESLSVLVVRDAATLRAQVAAWNRLVETAIEPNPFYEPAMLLPALEHLAAGQPFEVAIVEAAPHARADGPRVWCGLFPLTRGRLLPFGMAQRLAMWRHPLVSLCTPLIRAERAAQTLRAFFDWAGGDGRAALFDGEYLPGEGPVHELLVACLRDGDWPWWLADRYVRAVLRPAVTAEAYVRQRYCRKRRQETQRLHRRFAETGEITFHSLDPRDDALPWIQRFLQIEASGWKGDERTALGSTREERAYFEAATLQMHAQGRLLIHELRYQGQVVSTVCSVLVRDGGCMLKIAYDERYARFSPGVLLVQHMTRDLHERPGIAWFDSCACPDHPMIDHHWRERRTLETLRIATSRWGGAWQLAAGPVRRWLRSWWPRRRAAKTSRP